MQVISQSNNAQKPLTEIINNFTSGSNNHKDQVELYETIVVIARNLLSGQRSNVDISKTVLANETLIRFMQKPSEWKNRKHFYANLAIAMKQIVIDLVRKSCTQKRNAKVNSTESELDQVECTDILTEANKLESYLKSCESDPDLCRIIELKFFIGMSDSEIAEGLGCSDRTVKRKWTKAKQDLALYFSSY